MFDMNLMNDYLFLATDVALYHSNKLTKSTKGTTREKLTWTKTVFLGGGDKFTVSKIKNLTILKVAEKLVDGWRMLTPMSFCNTIKQHSSHILIKCVVCCISE